MIEARALEDDADRVEELAERAAACFADLQRLVRKRLANVELVAALGAAIRIGGHEAPPARANFIRGSRLLRGTMARHAFRFRERCTVRLMKGGVDPRHSSRRTNRGVGLPMESRRPCDVMSLARCELFPRDFLSLFSIGYAYACTSM